MKKEKTYSKRSEKEGHGKKEESAKGKEKPGLKVLVPLLSKREADPLFIEAVAGKAKHVILLLVIDTNSMIGQFGFATGEIAAGNALMEQVKTAFGKKRKKCNDVIEWGDTATKIGHLALLHKADRIFAVKQGNQFYQKVIKQLKESLKGMEIEEIALPAAE